MENINIWWEGPFDSEDIINGEIKENESDNIDKDIGLYQVYASHPLYGADVLVYIGLTTNSFKKRLKDRWVIEDGNDSSNVKIYLGCIVDDLKEMDTEIEVERIKKSEALLINALKPAFNSSNIQSVQEKYRNSSFQINNLNNYRNLYPHLSSQYFWNHEFENYNIVDKLAKYFKVKVSNEYENFYGFELPNNKSIFLGIDTISWNIHNVPLIISIGKKIIKQKSDIKKTFNYIREDEEEYFISISNDLNSTDIIEEIKKVLNQVQYCKNN